MTLRPVVTIHRELAVEMKWLWSQTWRLSAKDSHFPRVFGRILTFTFKYIQLGVQDTI